MAREKVQAAPNREAESTDAPERGGLPGRRFYALMAGSLFIFRRKLPDKEAPVPHAVLSLASRRVFAFVTGVAGRHSPQHTQRKRHRRRPYRAGNSRILFISLADHRAGTK